MHDETDPVPQVMLERWKFAFRDDVARKRVGALALDSGSDFLFGGFLRLENRFVYFQKLTIGGLSENDFICAAKVDALLPDG